MSVPTYSFIDIAHTQAAAQLRCLVGYIGSKKDTTLKKVADTLQRDLRTSDQLAVDVQAYTKAPSSCAHITHLFFDDGYHFALFINWHGTKKRRGRKTLEYRLYDATTGAMIANASGRYTVRGKDPALWAHHIADKVWPAMTGHEGMFLSKVAFCKKVILDNGVPVKHICIADHDGSNRQEVVNVPTINMAPKWSNDIRNPHILYTEHTDTNARLVSVSLKDKKRKIVSNFEGINMQPVFSPDGTAVVYCASRGDGRCQIYQFKKGELTLVTQNDGNNVSPTLADNGNTVYFCSDFKTGLPQIFAFHTDTGRMRRITAGGYCTSPAYCQKRKQLVYGKMIKGVMQLFLYDEKTKEHTQLTTSKGSKEECCWSPCGNYIAYSRERGNESRIVVLNLINRAERCITPPSMHCSYPAWSPRYTDAALFA